MHFLRTLKNTSFALLWSGQTISRLGDSFYNVALALWVLQKTGSATAMGLILAFSAIPTIILLLVGGVAVDRFSRIQMMLGSDAIRAVIVIAMAILAGTQRLELWHVYIMSAFFGAVDAFFYPAAYAIIPEIVAAEDRTSATSLKTLGTQFAYIIGPGLAGLSIALGGTSLAFAVDGASFVISALCLLAMPRKQGFAKPMDKDGSVIKDLREGLQTVLQSPWLWVTIAIAGVSNITVSGPYEAVLPLLVKQRFGVAASAQVYGLLLSVAAVGYILVALWIGQQKRLRRRGYLAYGAWLVAAIMLIFLGLPLPIVGMCLAIFTFNAGIGILNLAWANTLQEFIPPDRLGRVSSIDALGSYALTPIGLAVAGIVADHINAPSVFIAGGILSTLIIAIGLLHPRVRAVD